MRKPKLPTALYQKWKNLVSEGSELRISVFKAMPEWNHERPTSANPFFAWDVTFPTHHSCLRQIGLLSTGQIVPILFIVALSKLDQEA